MRLKWIVRDVNLQLQKQMTLFCLPYGYKVIMLLAVTSGLQSQVFLDFDLMVHVQVFLDDDLMSIKADINRC